jgi:cell shape-determining protein MreC
MVLSTERDALKVEIARLRTENDSQKQELSQLRDAAGLHAAVVRMTPGITAIVIARPPQSPYDTLLIAEGSKTGVRVGMEAFAQTGAPVGVVTSVNDDYAFVTLFSSYGRETAGWIGAKALPVSLVGSGGGTFGAEITRPADVAVGDRVYVPGPGMLAIGSIARIDDDPSQPSLVLRVVPAANFFSLTSVVLRDTGYADTFLRSATSTSL